jgi:hypothetical protein
MRVVRTGCPAVATLLSMLILLAPMKSTAQSMPRLFTIFECEGKVCNPTSAGSPIWSFGSAEGSGRFGTGVQRVTIEHLDASSIAVRRLDVGGPARGLSALYLGKIEGQRITGSVTYFDVGRPNAPRTDAWYGLMQGAPISVRASAPGVFPAPSTPMTLRECESARCLYGGAEYPIIWTFSGRVGRGWVGDSERPVVLEHLDAGFLMVRRIDGDALGGLTALYMGEIRGKQITGSVLYYDRAHPTVPRTDVWYGSIQDPGAVNTAVKNVPPSPRGGDTINPAPQPPSGIGTRQSDGSGTNPYEQARVAEYQRQFDGEGCPKDLLKEPVSNAFDAFLKGKTIQLERSDMTTDLDALGWYCRASRMGSGLAGFEVGELYFSGFRLPSLHTDGKIVSNGVDPDMAMAFRWYLRAAQAKNTEAMVKVAAFYKNGRQIYWRAGSRSSVNEVPVDLGQANHWLEMAAEAGDTEAMQALGGSWSGRLLTASLKTGSGCRDWRETMQSQMGDRVIRDVYAGESHDHAFFCVVTLEPGEPDPSFIGALTTMLQGGDLSSWRFTMYSGDGRNYVSTKASVREEAMRRATDMAIITAAMKRTRSSAPR